MARLNIRPSVISTIASSRETSRTPGPNVSDQENRDPSTRAYNKGTRRAMRQVTSEDRLAHNFTGSEDARGQKRKRPSTSQHDDQYSDDDEAKFNRYFDPNQDPELRRELKKKTRELDREFRESRDDLLRENGVALQSIVIRANETFKSVKQTGDATVDSRLLVDVSNLGFKKSAQLVLGDSSIGVDVDEFLSKCITYMRNGGVIEESRTGPSRTQRRTSAGEELSDDEGNEDGGEELDWELLGRRVCFPHNSRPPCPSFLLGPLSVEKKSRTQLQRRARQRQDMNARESRPENIEKEDLQQGQENQLTAICTRIKQQLSSHCARAQRLYEEAGISDIESARGKALLRKARITETGAPSLFDFVINPRSFGQTVENIFYVSFLIKEGEAGIDRDGNGLPVLAPATARTVEQKRRDKAQRHQAVLAIDHRTWRQLIEAYDIEEPLIPHREVEQSATLGERGWYA